MKEKFGHMHKDIEGIVYVNPHNRIKVKGSHRGLMNSELQRLKKALKDYPDREELTNENADIQLERARLSQRLRIPMAIYQSSM
jgi:hypothetical protein